MRRDIRLAQGSAAARVRLKGVDYMLIELFIIIGLVVIVVLALRPPRQ